MPDRPQESIQLARQALDTARANHERGDDRAALNRLYYACFHAARGVLYEKGFDPDSHKGNRMLFGREVVLTGEARGADGELLGELQDLRQSADYGLMSVSANVSQLAERTDDFVADMADLIDEEIDEDTDTDTNPDDGEETDE
jgi:uncharacterized protein (UPF0332 family)